LEPVEPLNPLDRQGLLVCIRDNCGRFQVAVLLVGVNAALGILARCRMRTNGTKLRRAARVRVALWGLCATAPVYRGQGATAPKRERPAERGLCGPAPVYRGQGATTPKPPRAPRPVPGSDHVANTADDIHRLGELCSCYAMGWWGAGVTWAGQVARRGWRPGRGRGRRRARERRRARGGDDEAEGEDGARGRSRGRGREVGGLGLV
jgi:hypothetical protein